VVRFAFLGTSGAVPSAERDTTALVIRAGGTTLMVDVGGSPVQKLRRLGADPLDLTAVVVTHLHPDHVYGLPALVQNLLILGRTAPLPVYCRVEHVEAVQGLLGLFGLADPDQAFPVRVAGVEPREGVTVLESPDLRVTASPNAHGPMPNLAVRVAAGERSLVYSSDTRPCAAVAELARGATVLVHESTFARPDPTQWHSTAAEAGQVARQAGVRRLVLAHVGYEAHAEIATLVGEARAAFGGAVAAAEDLRWYRV
jgi:ribonuclease Z